MEQAKCTVKVGQLLLTNCVQAHNDCLEVIPHIVLYLSLRRPRIVGSPGHVTPGFLKIRISKNAVFKFEDQFFFKKLTKNHQFVFGCAPHPFLTGLRPAVTCSRRPCVS